MTTRVESAKASGRVRFRDGIGVRMATADAFGEPIEQLQLCADLAGLESAVRERVSRLINFRHVRYVRLRGTERLTNPNKDVVIAYDAVPGARVSELLDLAVHVPLKIDTDSALQVVRELLPAIAVLHDSRNVTHGAIGPERLVVTPQGRLVIVDHGLGLALGKLGFSRRRFWQQLQVPVPPGTGKIVFDARTDVIQIGMVALALLLGRPIEDGEFPQSLERLLDGVKETTVNGNARPLSTDLRAWLERALPLEKRVAFTTVREAQQEFEKLFNGKRYTSSATALKALMTRYASMGHGVPLEPEPPAAFARAAALPLEPPPGRSTRAAEGRPSDPPLVVHKVDPNAPPKIDVEITTLADAVMPGEQPKPRSRRALVTPIEDAIPREELMRRVRASLVAGTPASPVDDVTIARNRTTVDANGRAGGLDLPLTPVVAGPLADSIWETEESAAAPKMPAAEAPTAPVAKGKETAPAAKGKSPDGKVDANVDAKVDARTGQKAAKPPVPAEVAAFEQVASDTYSDAQTTIATKGPSSSAGSTTRSASAKADVDAQAILLMTEVDDQTPLTPAVALDLPPDLDRLDAIADAREAHAPASGQPVSAAPPASKVATPPASAKSAGTPPSGPNAAPSAPASAKPYAPSKPASAGKSAGTERPATTEKTSAPSTVAPGAKSTEPAKSVPPVKPTEPSIVAPAAKAPESLNPATKSTPAPAPPVSAKPAEPAKHPASPAPVPLTPAAKSAPPIAEKTIAEKTTAAQPAAPANVPPKPQVAEPLVPAAAAKTPVAPSTPEVPAAGSSAVSSIDAKPTEPSSAPAPAVPAAKNPVTSMPVKSAPPVSEHANPSPPAIAEKGPSSATGSPSSIDAPVVTPAAVPPAKVPVPLQPAASVPVAPVAKTPAVESVTPPAVSPQASPVAPAATTPASSAPAAKVPVPAPSVAPPRVADPTPVSVPPIAARSTEDIRSIPVPPSPALPSVQPAATVMPATPVMPPVTSTPVASAPAAIVPTANTPGAKTPTIDLSTAHTSGAKSPVPSVPAANVAPPLPASVAPLVPASLAGGSLTQKPHAEPSSPSAPVAHQTPFGDVVGARALVSTTEADTIKGPADTLALVGTDVSPSMIEADVAASIAEAPSTGLVDEPTPIIIVQEPPPPKTSFAAKLWALAPKPRRSQPAERPAPAPELPSAVPTSSAPHVDVTSTARLVPPPSPQLVVAPPAAEKSPQVEQPAARARVDAAAPPASPPSHETSSPSPSIAAQPAARTDATEGASDKTSRKSSAFDWHSDVPVADAVPAWARGRTADDRQSDETADVEFDDDASALPPAAGGPIAPEAARGHGTVTPFISMPMPAIAKPADDPMSTRGSRSLLHAGAGFLGAAAADAADAADDLDNVVPMKPRRSLPRVRINVNWRRTLAASLVVALLEGVAFATAYWYVTPMETGSLLIETTPAGLEVLVDGRVAGRTPFSDSLTPGRHTIELRQGATSRVIPVEISAGVQTLQRVTWSAGLKTGQARVTATAPNAHVTIDGKKMGKTPLTVSTLAAGKHMVHVESDSGTVTTPIAVAPGETTELDVPVYPGWVSVLASVELQIFEGERFLGTTEGEKLLLAPGRHVLTFANETLGYRRTFDVTVTPGATAAVSLPMPKVPVTIEGPDGADLILDGELVGKLPISSLSVALGTRDFLFKHPDFGERRQVVTATLLAPVRVVVAR